MCNGSGNAGVLGWSWGPLWLLPVISSQLITDAVVQCADHGEKQTYGHVLERRGSLPTKLIIMCYCVGVVTTP